MMHFSALQQATGEATYIDDLPALDGELYAGLVISERAHAKFTLDCSALDNMKVHTHVKGVVTCTYRKLWSIINVYSELVGSPSCCILLYLWGCCSKF